MKTFKQTLHVYAKPEGTGYVYQEHKNIDGYLVFSSNYDLGDSYEGAVRINTIDVDVPYPDLTELTGRCVEALKEQIEEVKNKAHIEVTKLEEQINNLLCITHQVD